MDIPKRDQPAAVVVAGASASGKSTFGRVLARESRACLLDLDTVTNPLFEYAGGEHASVLSSPVSSRSPINSARYQCLIDAARENLALGNRVVLVAPFTQERSSPGQWQSFLTALDLEPDAAVLVWLDIPEHEAVRRARIRNQARDIVQLQHINRFARSTKHYPPPVEHIAIDGMLPTDEQLTLFRARKSTSTPVKATQTSYTKPGELTVNNLSTRERRGLAAISTNAGRMLVIAADQRNGMKAVMQDSPGGPESISAAELSDAKSDVVRFLGNAAPAILLDPEVAVPHVADTGILSGHTALVVGLDASGFELVDGLRYTKRVPNMSVAKVEEMGADVIKMLWYVRSDKQDAGSTLADEIRSLTAECSAQGILLIVELLVYPLEGETPEDYERAFPQLVAGGAALAVRCGAKVLKLQYPGSGSACDAVTAAADGTPWAVLSAVSTMRRSSARLK